MNTQLQYILRQPNPLPELRALDNYLKNQIMRMSVYRKGGIALELALHTQKEVREAIARLEKEKE